jgi:hypothetical protein
LIGKRKKLYQFAALEPKPSEPEPELEPHQWNLPPFLPTSSAGGGASKHTHGNTVYCSINKSWSITHGKDKLKKHIAVLQ